ncbi:MAG: acylphosphatase [Rubripirellula sp.]
MSRVRYLVRYKGHVQGVGFRMTAVAQGRGLDLHGDVRNEPDGSVLMDVEGTERDIQSLMQRIASEMSGKIDDVHKDSREPTGKQTGFQVRY